MDNGAKSLGKTISDAYIELSSRADADKVVQRCNRTYLKGRLVTVRPASENEFLRRLFPFWGKLGGSDEPAMNVYLKRDEINSLLMVCKNYKLHFSRKSADR